MPEPDPGPPDTSFLRLVQLATSISMGAMAGALYSIKEVNPTVQLEVSFASVVSFVFAAVATWMFWRPIIRDNLKNDRKRQGLALVGMIVVLVVGLGIATSRALKNHEQLGEIVQGALMATGVLAFVGFLIWRTGQLLKDDPPPPDQP